MKATHIWIENGVVVDNPYREKPMTKNQEQKRGAWQLSQATRVKKILALMDQIETDSTSKRGYRPTNTEREKIAAAIIGGVKKLELSLEPQKPAGFSFEAEDNQVVCG